MTQSNQNLEAPAGNVVNVTGVYKSSILDKIKAPIEVSIQLSPGRPWPSTYNLPGDSGDYELLTEAVAKVEGVEGFTCEIGLRQGGGSYAIMEALKSTNQQKIHIAIDPYGNIDYPEGDNGVVCIERGYTNSMRDGCLLELYLYCHQSQRPFLFFNLEDTEFFTRYDDGVPVYRHLAQKQLINQYALVHFDGPHTVANVTAEVDFFHPRSPVGAVWVFDDVKLYDHKIVDSYIQNLGWERYASTNSGQKWTYCKQS